MGRDSILLKLMSRSANTLSALNSAPGTFFKLNASEVLSALTRRPRLSPLDQKEARKVFLVILNSGL